MVEWGWPCPVGRPGWGELPAQAALRGRWLGSVPASQGMFLGTGVQTRLYMVLGGDVHLRKLARRDPSVAHVPSLSLLCGLPCVRLGFSVPSSAPTLGKALVCVGGFPVGVS